MINYSNMLDCVAAHLLARESQRLHITDRQLAAANVSKSALEVWAASKRLSVTTGEMNGYSGFFISLDERSAA